jgi:CheY-like chemotaxis protein
MDNNITVCIVDDDDVYKFAINKTIEINQLAHKVLMFSDGEEAITFINDHLDKLDDLPDIILLDLNMPIMDGWQFLEEYIKIKPRIGKKITVYLVSSSVDKIDLERAEKISEISDYIIKPITPDKLKDIIRILKNSWE